MQKILIVEDDIDIQDILKNHLIDAGYEVAVASDGVTGIAMFDDTIDLVLLDIMLPKIDGYGVCEVIRKRSQVPIIMLTALSDEENQLKGFEQQIDDYIPKPFSPKILLCKIAAILRRRTAENLNPSLLIYKELSMDVDGFHVYQGGNEVVLTSKEFALLRLMLENQGKVFTRQMLLDRLWADDLEVEDRIVDSHIKNIRKKLNADYIKTIRGGWDTELIRKIKTSLTAKLFLATTVLLILVCLLSVFSMARYIPQTYSNRLSAELQKQANDLVPVLEKAGSLEECYSLVQQFTAQTKATAYIEDSYGDILYSSDKLTITTDKDSIATIQENPDSAIITSDELLTEAGYVFNLLGSDYTIYVQSDTVSVNQATEAIWQTVPLVILGIFFMSILFSVIYSRYITKPIIELSSTSQKMAQLNFEPHGNSNRSDEIGILSDSLNTLSDNLQHTLAELKKSNSELEAEISKERELEKRQQEFFSAASHELKTPLTILKGHLMGMLNKVKGYENQETYMDRSLAVVEKMETLVKELLYVSKTDGKQRTEYKTIDFAELLRVQIADVTDLLSEKGIFLSVDIPDKILCDADPAQMERAIQNVLVNAIRYSPNGEAIYISLSNDKNIVSCKVENTGVHIPEEMIPHLFEAFYRADTSRNRNTGGTGLGLYIVRKIMELHHAKYGIQNTSRGVVFWLEMQQERGAINSI